MNLIVMIYFSFILQVNPVNRIADLPSLFMRLTGICDYPYQTNMGG